MDQFRECGVMLMGGGGRGLHLLLSNVCWLVAYRPSNSPVYLRDGSTQTTVRAATLR